ncbi:MAG: glycosyltransferase [Tannerellaceae bacterium]|nr:glycosyltransferase [Tannerellaceae bacterium]
MKVCDVVLNSIWYDPRVRKQIAEYLANDINVSCVGLKCTRYDIDKVNQIPCCTDIVQIPAKLDGKQRGVIRKIRRELTKFRMVRDAIIKQCPDVIHANDLNALIPAYAAKKRLKCSLIYDSHEINVENYTSEGRSYIAGFMKAIEHYLVKHVDLMVCVSNAAADYFAETYKIKKPMVVTNCSLLRERCEVSSDNKKGFEVLNHGQFYEGRGYELMIEACDLLKDYPEIKLAVRGFGRLESSMRKQVSLKTNKDNFIFYPPVGVESLIPMASASSVGVAITMPICLNFKLSVSNKLFEYASAGLPVIMSDIPEHRFLNNKYRFGIILEETTPECFAKAVIKLYTDKEFYDCCRKNALKMTAALNWENEFASLINKEHEISSNE